MDSDLVTIDIEERDGAVVARLAGEVDLSNAGQVRETLLSAAQDRPLVVVLSELEYLDSAGIATLYGVAELGPPGSLRLVVAPDAIVRRTVLIAGLDSALPVDETLEEALAAHAGA